MSADNLILFVMTLCVVTFGIMCWIGTKDYE